jgi:protein O-mannosyl-transferase
MPSSYTRFALIMLFLCLATIIVYARTAYSPFFMTDDDDYVVRNIHVASGLSFSSIAWAFTTFHAGNWHPLTWLSLMTDSQLFGTNPMGYHLVNVALHTANSALLFLLFRSMSGALWRSALVAALFALHPLHVESVAWIAERKDVLSGLFWILTLLCYTAYVKQSKRSMYLLSLALFALGLMAKPMLVTIPAVLLLIDFWPLKRIRIPFFADSNAAGAPASTVIELTRLRDLVVEKIPFLALATISSVVTFYAQSHAGAVAALNRLALSDRISNAFWSYIGYVRKMFFPYDLAVYYPLVPVPYWQSGCAAIMLCGGAIIVVRQARTRPYLAFGYFWYIITLLPVIGFIQVGGQAMADRYSYLPHIGLFTTLSWGGAELSLKLPRLRKTAIFAAGGAVLLCAILTWVQVGYWTDNIRIYRHSLDVTKDNYFAYNGLGRAYEQQGRMDLAIAQYNEALRIMPRDPEFLVNLGNALDNQGRTAEAIGSYEEALRVNPRLAEGHYNLGLALARHGKLNEAMAEYSEALRIKPESPQIESDLGNALDDQGRTAEAIGHYEEALRLAPNFTQGHYNLGVALERVGRFDEAIRHYSEALRLNPGFEEAARNLQSAQKRRNSDGIR